MTAVEWLEKIHHGQKGQPFDDYEWEIAFNHAKEMEKEQLSDAWYADVEVGLIHNFEQYYNKTFKSE
jgi:hypothetical protein